MKQAVAAGFSLRPLRSMIAQPEGCGYSIGES